MAEFAGLREMHRRLADEKVRDLYPVSHGNALSVYFLDPEGNRIELFVDTPWYCKQPMRIPMDMNLPDEKLWAWAESGGSQAAGLHAGRRVAREACARDALKSFVYTGLPSRVVFGAGSVKQLGAELDRLGAKRALLLCTPGRAEACRPSPRDCRSPACSTASSCTRRSRSPTRRGRPPTDLKADCCIAIGGGSTIGFGKAVALTSGLPVIAVPTTYSGSEMTTIWGISEGETKRPAAIRKCCRRP